MIDHFNCFCLIHAKTFEYSIFKFYSKFLIYLSHLINNLTLKFINSIKDLKIYQMAFNLTFHLANSTSVFNQSNLIIKYFNQINCSIDLRATFKQWNSIN